MRDFVFVLEQTLGHVAHTRNLERVVAAETDISARFVRLAFEPQHRWDRLPALRNWSVRASLEARRGLNRELAARRADCLFIHTQVAALFSIGIMRLVPTVVSLDATPVNFDSVGGPYSHHVSRPAVEAAKRLVNRRALNAAAAVVTWSRWASASVERDYGVARDKIHVIPPGVDTAIFSPGARSHDGPVRLLFVGGDLDRKGGADLIESLSGLAGQVEVDLVTGGDPPPAPAGVQVRVHHGLRPQSPELVRLYREADVFVLPARGDCLPQAIAEAMSSGLPVISTPVGAISELVQDGVTGLLVPPRSPAELARAVAVLARDSGRRWAMGRAGLEEVRRHHDMARNNRSVLSLMSDLAEAQAIAVSAA